MKISDAYHAFITGGANGIGLAIAQVLASRGVKVTLADVDETGLDEAVRASGGGFGARRLDTRDRDGWAVAKAAAESAFGPVDILVNNAGIAPDGRRFAEMDPASFDRIVGINLTGVFNGVSAFAGDMQERRRGHIVNTSSMAGISPGFPGLGAYAAAKFGVVGLSETLRAEMAPHGVGVSILCPGFVPTRLEETTRRLGGQLREGGGRIPPGALGADIVAEKVLDGIERDLPYIITHPDNWPRVEQRHIVLREAFGATQA
ncbi:MAG: SDR family oxidoreductase [Sphingobium sp.]